MGVRVWGAGAVLVGQPKKTSLQRSEDVKEVSKSCPWMSETMPDAGVRAWAVGQGRPGTAGKRREAGYRSERRKAERGVRGVIRDLKAGGPAGRCERVAVDSERHGTHRRVLSKE